MSVLRKGPFVNRSSVFKMWDHTSYEAAARPSDLLFGAYGDVPANPAPAPGLGSLLAGRRCRAVALKSPLRKRPFVR